MSALAQIDDDQLVSQPDRGTIFLARRDGLRLTKVSRYPIRGASGQQVGETPGEVLVFRDARFYCPAEGTVAVEDGREIDAAEVRAWLLGGTVVKDGQEVTFRPHRLLGDVNEGFWAVETKAPPVSREELDRIVNATMQWDVPTLERILEQERAGWEREDVLQVAEGAIERIHAMEAKLRDEAATEADERVREAEQRAEQDRAAAAQREQELEDVRRQLAEAQAAAAAQPSAPAQPEPTPAATPKPAARRKRS